MAETFEIGDVVYLKSGSPAMTIQNMSVGKSRIRCVWFNGKDNKSELFAAANLTKTKPQD